MPATEMTEDKKNDLTVLQMRKILDPKRFYKNPDLKVVPKYFQVTETFISHILVCFFKHFCTHESVPSNTEECYI